MICPNTSVPWKYDSSYVCWHVWTYKNYNIDYPKEDSFGAKILYINKGKTECYDPFGYNDEEELCQIYIRLNDPCQAVELAEAWLKENDFNFFILTSNES